MGVDKEAELIQQDDGNPFVGSRDEEWDNFVIWQTLMNE